MSPSELRAKLQGVIGFPVTPFKADLSLDIGGFRRNLRAMLRHPPAAIVAAGGTGELYSLSAGEHRGRRARRRRREQRERCRSSPAPGSTARSAPTSRARPLTAGASGILAFPPYYPGAEDEGLFEYYRTIGSATGPRAADLQPRLVPSVAGARRAADSD